LARVEFSALDSKENNAVSFTGERYIPGQGGCQLAYEHLHRYLFALRWAQGEQVLDLACGNGYGAALLARRASHVWALDVDGEAIAGARKDWCANNLTFVQGDAVQLPLRGGSIGLVVAMEVLEHIKDQEQLLQEIARVCSEDGIALVSTPNKAVYSDAREYVNPFHVCELYLDDFVALLKKHFRYIEVVGQQIRAGSLLSSNSADASFEVIVEPPPGVEKTALEPVYYLAICSNEMLRIPIPARSAYVDPADGLFLETKEEIHKLGQWAKSLEVVIGERDHAIRALQTKVTQEVDQRDFTIRGLQEEMAQRIEEKDRWIEERDQRIKDLLNLYHQKEKEFDDRGKWALSLQAEVEQLGKARQSLIYRFLSRIGLLPK
jgi:O-antigen biosynthesis protein